MNKHIFLFFFIIISVNVNAGFIKISSNGKVLNSDAKSWLCVLDGSSNLMWEVKTTEDSFRSNLNTYTWFDGISGVEDGEYSHNCFSGESCNSKKYIEDLNRKYLCGINKWRLPTLDELKGLLVYKDEEPLIDVRLFPNTIASTYWSSSTSSEDENIALDVPFFYGGTVGSDKSFDSHIRAVYNVD
jgi:hypothetical protein